jgi:TonB-dependent SusC/RagA subfamily outer membrane receptor
MFKIIPNLRRRSLLLLACLFLYFGVSAQVKISGKVTSSDDKLPIIGASVKVKNTKVGTITDPNGIFAIIAKSGDVLSISFVGYGTREITVGAQNTIDVVLQPDANSLSEIVVTGYTSQRKKDLTGSVAVVNITQLKSQPAAIADESLQGKAPGVQIVNDGAPGSTPQIRVRGVTTINNNDPLYVIDGVPYEGKLSWFNQNDIESMQVLKDASSASIYGARANNGVVIITTKKGTLGAPSPLIEMQMKLRPQAIIMEMALGQHFRNTWWQEKSPDRKLLLRMQTLQNIITVVTRQHSIRLQRPTRREPTGLMKLPGMRLYKIIS